MQFHTTGSFIIAALALAGCGGHRAVEINPNSQSYASRWNATLATPSGLAGVLQVEGTAWMAPSDKDSMKTHVEVRIANASPGGVHPWHVHRGQCGQDLGIVGGAGAYKPIKVKGNGQAEGDADLTLPTPRSGGYFVNVHASAANMSTIVACGNLAPPLR